MFKWSYNIIQFFLLMCSSMISNTCVDMHNHAPNSIENYNSIDPLNSPVLFLNRPPTLQTLTLAYNDILPSGDFILHHHRLGMHIVLLSLSLLFDILLLLINLCRSCSSFSTFLRLCIELCNYISVKS